MMSILDYLQVGGVRTGKHKRSKTKLDISEEHKKFFASVRLLGNNGIYFLKYKHLTSLKVPKDLISMPTEDLINYYLNYRRSTRKRKKFYNYWFGEDIYEALMDHHTYDYVIKLKDKGTIASMRSDVFIDIDMLGNKNANDGLLLYTCDWRSTMMIPEVLKPTTCLEFMLIESRDGDLVLISIGARMNSMAEIIHSKEDLINILGVYYTNAEDIVYEAYLRKLMK